MNDDVVISVEGLSKRYRLGQIGRDTLRDSIHAWWHRFRGRDPEQAMGEIPVGSDSAPPIRSARDDKIWALKDVSFDVKRGEVLGIIGKNGAGKSTLLKILSRITEPTSGRAVMRGRVASLLEVGTGFHPELTGRENVYLNGTILGMKKSEIDRKFDDIVAFSELEPFIDTPVKRYSSGMYVRLAFAVAAHLDPEILLVDEVLAVGDIGFQRKCLGKMEDISKEGRTVLFVSHNMGAIQRLCGRVVLLAEGCVSRQGDVGPVTQEYLMQGMELLGERRWETLEEAPGNDVVRVRAVRVANSEGRVSANFDVCEPIRIEVEYHVLKEGYPLIVQFDLLNAMGHHVFQTKDNRDAPWSMDKPRPVGFYRSVCHVPGDFLNEGDFFVSYGIDTWVPTRLPAHANANNILFFFVSDRMDPSGVRGNFVDEWTRNAVVRPRFRWETEYQGTGEAGGSQVAGVKRLKEDG